MQLASKTDNNTDSGILPTQLPTLKDIQSFKKTKETVEAPVSQNRSSECQVAPIRRIVSTNLDAPLIKRKTQRRVRAQALLNVPLEASENIERLEKNKDQEVIELIRTALKNHFVFTSLDEHQTDKVLGQFFYCEVKKDKYVFRQDDEANCFYIIEKGKMQVNINDKEKKILGPGNSFGELALLYNAPRSASIKALEDSFLWGIDGYTFRMLVQEMILKDLEENKQFIEKIPLFKNLTSDQKEGIASILIKQKFPPNAYIIHEGDNADSYYIVKKGTVSVLKETTEVRTLSEGDTFGEAALLEFNNVRLRSVKAITEVICLALGRDTLISILGDKVQNIACRNIMKWAFEQEPLLSKLKQTQKEKVYEAMKSFFGKLGEEIFLRGQEYDKLVIPIDGNLVERDTEKIVCEKGNVFGLLADGQENQVPEDIVLDSESMYCEIPIKDFEFLIGGPLKTVIKMNGEKKTIEQFEDEKQFDVPFSNLVYLKKIGQGQFGSVHLVEDNKGNMYALKTVSKAKVFSLCLEKHIQDERRVLKVLKSPFIMKFFRTYKDENNVYFLTEFIKGMELFDVIREIGLLTKLEAQFYIGNMILAIEYLHRQNIIYRDVKPENIMITSTGYAKLIDMGTCKTLGKPGFRTFTIIGTPTYMAPEVVSGKGYSFAVDYWSIGICLYEFVCGYVPFGESSDDPYEIYNEILTKPLDFPHYMRDAEAKKLMQQMLNRMPEVRANGGFAALKAHKWFGEGFNWEKLIDQEMNPPYIPPAEKMVSDVELAIAKKQNQKIVDVLQNELNDNSPKLPVNAQAQASVWDTEF